MIYLLGFLAINHYMVKNILPLKLKRFPIYLYSELDLHSRMEICSSDTLTNELLWYSCKLIDWYRQFNKTFKSPFLTLSLKSISLDIVSYLNCLYFYRSAEEHNGDLGKEVGDAHPLSLEVSLNSSKELFSLNFEDLSKELYSNNDLSILIFSQTGLLDILRYQCASNFCFNFLLLKLNR